jgi:TetR/AcrR family transcriptional regulator, regulator of cefoperazone and chloramphenicol sensitivity
MSDAEKKPKKQSRVRSAASIGYKKGEETRHRILDAALQAFGEASFKAVTTRQICASAEVSLPTLTYYFGDKEGLYRACAEAVVDRYRARTSGAAANAARVLGERCSPEIARAHLKAVIGALAGLLVESREAEGWVQFVGRELRDPGPAFEILYERLWRPGAELTSHLIGRIRGRVEPADDDRIQALLLISGLLAFQSGRNISMRSLKWSKIGPAEFTQIRSCLDAQIDAIDRKRSGF